MKSVTNFPAGFPELHSNIDLPLITRIIPPTTIHTIIKQCNAQEKRIRALPAWLVVLLCIMRGLFPTEALSTAMARICFIPALHTNFNLAKLPKKSALCLARYRLGAQPLVALFKSTCRPLATENTPDAFFYGLRLVGIDTTFETVADSVANAFYFGRNRNGMGRKDSAFPNSQAIYLLECSTHVIFDAGIMPFKVNHHIYFRRMLRSVNSSMLVMFDRGLQSYEGFAALKAKETHFITPAMKSANLKPIRNLPDGTYIAEIKDWNTKQAPIEVRVIDYIVNDLIRNPNKETSRMFTSLMDWEKFPAMEIVLIYHQRWEVEIAIDEIDTHQREPWIPFRSQKPVGVIQEFYSILLANFIVASFRHESADKLELSPQKLSFVNTLRLIQHTMPVSQLLWRTHKEQLLDVMTQWQVYFKLPKREDVINPRAVRRKRNKFKRKSTADKSLPVEPFEDVLQLISA